MLAITQRQFTAVYATPPNLKTSRFGMAVSADTVIERLLKGEFNLPAIPEGEDKPGVKLNGLLKGGYAYKQGDSRNLPKGKHAPFGPFVEFLDTTPLRSTHSRFLIEVKGKKTQPFDFPLSGGITPQTVLSSEKNPADLMDEGKGANYAKLIANQIKAYAKLSQDAAEEAKSSKPVSKDRKRLALRARELKTFLVNRHKVTFEIPPIIFDSLDEVYEANYPKT